MTQGVPTFSDRSAEWREHFDSAWWRDQRLVNYREMFGSDNVERAVHRVYRLYDEKWARKLKWHPFGMYIFGSGHLILDFHMSLADDLDAVQDASRLRSVEKDLKNSGDCGSARLELNLAASLKRKGHVIEFRPPSPNGKTSDFVASSHKRVYFEIKRLQRGDQRLALDRLVQDITSRVSDLLRGPHGASLRERGCEIELSEMVAAKLDARTQRQENGRTVIQDVLKSVEEYLVSGVTELVIPDLAKIKSSGGRLSVMYHPKKDEPGRIIRLVEMAHEQLHPDHPGIVVVQSGAPLEADQVQQIGHVLSSTNAKQLAAVIVTPEYFGFPLPFMLFHPFYVQNRNSDYDVTKLVAFKDLSAVMTATAETVAAQFRDSA